MSEQQDKVPQEIWDRIDQFRNIVTPATMADFYDLRTDFQDLIMDIELALDDEDMVDEIVNNTVRPIYNHKLAEFNNQDF